MARLPTPRKPVVTLLEAYSSGKTRRQSFMSPSPNSRLSKLSSQTASNPCRSLQPVWLLSPPSSRFRWLSSRLALNPCRSVQPVCQHSSLSPPHSIRCSKYSSLSHLSSKCSHTRSLGPKCIASSQAPICISSMDCKCRTRCSMAPYLSSRCRSTNRQLAPNPCRLL